MPIKRRSGNIRETVAKVSERSEQEDRTRARNPFLSGLRQDVYRFVYDNPDCTRVDVARGVGLPNNVATARIKELIDESYLFEPPGKRKINPSGVHARVLRVTDRPEGGQPLDRVQVEVTLTIDHKGNYGATAKVINGGQQSGHGAPIKRQRVTITAPHPDTFKGVFKDSQASTVSRMETEQYADDIIDGDYQIVEG